MKKLNMIVSVVVMCILVMALPGQTVEAKGGSICMELEKGEADTSVEGVEFSYRKVADLVNGEIENVQFPKLITEERLQSAKGCQQAALELEQQIRDWDGTVRTDASGKVCIQNVSDGMYLLSMTDRNAYEMVEPILVNMPTWNDQTKQMEREIRIIPKHEPISGPVAPQTNLKSDEKQKVIGASLCALGGVLFLAFLSRKGEDEEAL